MNKKLFCVCNFTSNLEPKDLVSVAIVDDSHHIFYSQITDYDKSTVNDWGRNNSLASLFTEGDILNNRTKLETKSELKNWIAKFNDFKMWIFGVEHFDFNFYQELLEYENISNFNVLSLSSLATIKGKSLPKNLGSSNALYRAILLRHYFEKIINQ